MKIVIVGDGKVGNALARQLSSENHDITMIDKNAARLNDSVDRLDIMGVVGNGASIPVLQEADTGHCDVLIAAASLDEANLLSCVCGRHLGVPRTIARVRNPEYNDQLYEMRETMGLSMMINPERATAQEIIRVIAFPAAVHIDTFAMGRVELVEYGIDSDSPLVGVSLLNLPHLFKNKVLICAVERSGEVTIPKGDFTLLAGDRIHITGTPKEISGFLDHLEGEKQHIRSIMILGGGRIAFYLCQMLGTKYQIKIIEKDYDRCEEICDRFPHVVVIHANGSDINLLESEGLLEIDAFIALSGMDEENLVTAMVANQRDVPKVITKITRNDYQSILENIHDITVVNPKMSAVNHIVSYVRSLQNSHGLDHVITIYKLVNGKAEADEFLAGAKTHFLGRPFSTLSLKPNMLVGAIIREDKVIIPTGNDCILEGDHVVVVSGSRSLHSLNDIFGELPS